MKSRIVILLIIYTFIICVCAGVNVGFKNNNKKFDSSGYHTMLGILTGFTILLAVLIHLQGEKIPSSAIILFALATSVCMWLTGQINKENSSNEGSLSKENTYLAITSALLFIITGLYAFFHKDTLINSYNKVGNTIRTVKDTLKNYNKLDNQFLQTSL